MTLREAVDRLLAVAARLPPEQVYPLDAEIGALRAAALALPKEEAGTVCHCGRRLSPGKCGICDNDE